jgi:hypothetical protein
MLASVWHHVAMPKPKTKKQKLPARNPSDPILLARAVMEAAIGEPFTPPKKNKKKTSSRKSK